MFGLKTQLTLGCNCYQSNKCCAAKWFYNYNCFYYSRHPPNEPMGVVAHVFSGRAGRGWYYNTNYPDVLVKTVRRTQTRVYLPQPAAPPPTHAPRIQS